MRSGLVIVALLGFLHASGWQQPNSATVNSVQKCAISGTVIDATNNQPLQGARVAIRRNRSVGGVTDSGGHFEIKNIPPGRYHLRASRAGYISMQYGQHNLDSPGRTLTLAAGQNMTDISFRLFREAVITGHIYDKNGNPIQDAQAEAFIYGYSGGKRQLLFAKSTVTDDRGKFRLFGLAPGTYYIAADVGPGFGSGKNAMSYSATYYPGVVDASAASPVTLRAGDEFTGADFPLQEVGTFHIRGHVVGPAATGPDKDFTVQLIPKNQTMSFPAMGIYAEVRNGDFDFSNVRPGSYEVTAWVNIGGRGLQASAPVQVVDSDVNGVNLALVPGATLRGHVEVEGTVDMSKFHVILRPQGLPYYGMNEARELPGGNFEFQNVMDGSYRVELGSALPPNAYLKSTILDGEDVLESGLTVANGQAPGSMLNVVISAYGGKISGVVMLQGKPLADARVTLAPADESKLTAPLWFKDAATDQNGNFLIQGIRPGKYLAFAWQNIEEGEDRDPAFLTRFRDRG